MKVQRFHNIISIALLHHSYQNLWCSSDQEIGIWEFQTVNLTTSYWNFLPLTIHSHGFNINQNISWSNFWWNNCIVIWKYSKTSNLLLEVVIIIKLYDKACNSIVCFFEQEFNELCKQWTILSITPNIHVILRQGFNIVET